MDDRVDYRRCCQTRWTGNFQCLWFDCHSFVMNKIKWKRNVILSFVSVSNGYQFHFNFFSSNFYAWDSFIQTRKWFWIEYTYSLLWSKKQSSLYRIDSILIVRSQKILFKRKPFFTHDIRSKWMKRMFSALSIESHMSFQTFSHALRDAHSEEIVSSP